MNRLLIIFVSLCCYCIIGQSQDLIRNTQRGISNKKQTNEKHRIYELIESRKISDARFIENTPFEYQEVSPKESYQEYVSEAVFLKLNEQLLQKLRLGERDISLNIPTSDDQNIELELTRVSITVDDFQIETSNGKSRLEDAGLFYRGVVKDDPHSFAAISVFDDHIRGLIADDDGNYVLGKLGKRSADYILYNDRNLVQVPDLKCDTPDENIPVNFPTPNTPVENISSAVGDKCVQVYIVCDHAMYDTLGNVGSVAKYALALFHESAIIYFNENIEIEINQIRVWDTPDPWQAETSKCALKNDFAASTSNFPGYIAHLLSTKSIGGGCASGAAFCDDETHAVTGGLNEFDPFPTYTTEVYLFTHEMGHQLGSPHTQNCAWNGNCTPIDGCVNSVDDNCDPASPSCPNGPVPPVGGGTIMSYCNPGNAPTVGINLTNGFGTQPGDLIRANVDAANCMSFECDCTDYVNRTMFSNNYSQWTYSASNSISASGGVDRPDHTPVIFRTGNYIRLTDFTAHSGSTFLATVHPDICDDYVFFNSPSTNNFVEIENHNKTLTETNEDGISDLLIQTHDLNIYPIPFTNSVTVEFNLEKSDLVDIRILNVSGQLISNLQSKSTMDKGWHKLDYDTTELPAGVYQLLFQTSKGTTVRKLIRVH